METYEISSRQSVELLVPSVQFGNVKIVSEFAMKAILSSKDDRNEASKLLAEKTRKIALEVLLEQKADIDAQLTREDFILTQFDGKR